MAGQRSQSLWGWGHLWHPPALCSEQGQAVQWPRNTPRCLLDVPKGENITNSTGNPIHCSAIHMEKKDGIYIEMEFPEFQVVPTSRQHWESLVFPPQHPG